LFKKKVGSWVKKGRGRRRPRKIVRRDLPGGVKRSLNKQREDFSARDQRGQVHGGPTRTIMGTPFDHFAGQTTSNRQSNNYARRVKGGRDNQESRQGEKKDFRQWNGEK